MLRLDHVVRNCKDESVNFTGNIGEELKKLQTIIIEFLVVPYLSLNWDSKKLWISRNFAIKNLQKSAFYPNKKDA